MGTVDRIKLLVRANINDTLKKAEDPVKTSALMLDEMRENVRSVKKYLVSATADLRRMERSAEEHDCEAQRWSDRAAFALGKNEDDLARKALGRKRALQTAAESIRAQLPQQRAGIETLKADLEKLEEQIEAIRQKRTRLVAKAEYASKARPVTKTAPAPVPSDVLIDAPALDAYEDMVARVEDLEATAAAIEEMNPIDRLEEQLQDLEVQDEVERELRALRDKQQATS